MRSNKLLVVVHVVDPTQALFNVNVALENGADGVFLINHAVSSGVLLVAYEMVRTSFPEAWVGLNFLDLTGRQVLELLPVEADGLWRDNAGIEPYGPGGFIFTEARQFKEERARFKRDHVQYFGGVAFKYQMPVTDPEGVARIASQYVDVVTTSGEETGSPPSLNKVWAMRKGAPEKPLAIASGMTPENVDPFLEYIDYFLVATGISKSHTELDPVAVYAMAKKMRR